MQVKQLAAALVAAFPLVAAAQSSVVIYGIADASFGRENNGVTRTTSVGSGNQSTNRVGFRGVEDLGNGMKALFNLEAGYAIDTGAGDATLFGRRAVVGLGGDWGQVTVGREYTPVASIAQWSDAMGQGLYGTNLGAFGTGKLTRRVSNSVNYRTNPMFGGLSVMGVYSAGEKSGAVASNDLVGGGFEYTGGPLSFGMAYQTYERVMTGDDHESIIGVSFKEGNVEVKGNIMKADLAGPGAEFKEHNLGATYTMGASKFYVNYKQNRLSGGAKATGYALGYTYTLSKRTNVYATWARTNNNATGNFVLASAGTTLTPGAIGRDPSALVMGVRHAF
jgi:predicted porin